MKFSLRFLVVPALLFPASSFAATWTVNSTTDTDDGTCDVSHCSLREAIDELGDNDDIDFSFAGGTGLQTITLGSPLPSISAQDVLIDGFACTGCGTVTENTNTPDLGLNSSLGIELVGNFSGTQALMLVSGSGVTVQGFVVRDAPDDGIRITGEDVIITGCYVGTDATGTIAAPNGDNGIKLVDAPGAVIGPYNLVSGNGDDGIDVAGDSDSIAVFGNLVGTDITGMLDLGNADEGIQIGSGTQLQDLMVGGDTAADRNVVSGNGGEGILIRRDVDGTSGTGAFIEGNTVGLTADGLFVLANDSHGIHFEGNNNHEPRGFVVEDNIVGGNGGAGMRFQSTQNHDLIGNLIGTNTLGFDLGNLDEGIYAVTNGDKQTKKLFIGDVSRGGNPGYQNEIAFNGGDGIRLHKAGSQQNREHEIGANSIHSNGGLGIDLEASSAGDGASLPSANANCSGQANGYGNRGIGKPVLTSASLEGGLLLVEGTSCGLATVDVYIADVAASGNGQPATFVGTTTADAAGNWSYSSTGTAVATADWVTALQTDADAETSEAGENVEVITCDADLDGFDDQNQTVCGGTDCDDSDPATYPGATEICDGVDNDCDFVVPVNEVDVDLDTYFACDDCDDIDPAVNPGATETCNAVDDDCDSMVDEDFDVDQDGVSTCGADGDPSTIADNDCDDTAITTFPGATETCNAADDDCDSTVDEGFDVDLDGFTTCGADGDPSTIADNDCDDAVITTFPGATEVCDAVDQDCDAVVDEDFDVDQDGVSTCGADGDVTTTADNDCDDGVITTFPGASETCNAVDDDCDSTVDEDFDVDLDGFTTCGADGDVSTTADNDCDDGVITTFPGATETCNAVDDDCEGGVDEDFDVDQDGFTTCGADGDVSTTADNDCDDGVITTFPGAMETCNAVDDDCDAGVDEDFDVDLDGYTTCGADGDAGTTVDNDCDDNAPAVNPGATELCNGFDDDCDGLVDENADGDGDGVTNCDGDCDDTDPTVYPGATELCDGLDTDCDGAVPAVELDDDGDGFNECGGDVDCDDTEITVYPAAPELCDGLDNNCDTVVPADELDVDGDGIAICDGDCDDDDDGRFPGNEEICSDGIDQDCDGVDADDLDLDGDGWSSCDGDCDDANIDVNPGAEEVCGDGVDNDCDGVELDLLDADDDGVTSCDGDCDDEDGDVFPGNPEVCNGLDDDCNDEVDEHALDLDLDGYDDCEDCDDDRDDVFPDAEELCDGLDGDCDGFVPDDELDLDGDGLRPCGGDCDDADATVLPGAEEVCGDGIDQDCDEVDASCGGSITLGTPTEPTGCGSSMAGGANPAGAWLPLGLVLGLAGLRSRRRWGLPALLVPVVLAGCVELPTGARVQTWWGAADATDDLFFEAGGAIEAAGFTNAFDRDGVTWTEISLVGADGGTDCAAYAAFRRTAADAVATLAEALESGDRSGPQDLAGLLCQGVDAAAREAFGWDGGMQAVHFLVRGEPVTEIGAFLPSMAVPTGPVMAVLPEDGRFATRYVERGGLGVGLLPSDGDPSEDANTACIGRSVEAFGAWDAGELGQASATSIAAWAIGGRRGEHHDPRRGEVAHEAGGTSTVGLALPEFTSPSSPGSILDVTGFVTLADAPDGNGFERAVLGTPEPAVLESCPALTSSSDFAWPEAGGAR